MGHAQAAVEVLEVAVEDGIVYEEGLGTQLKKAMDILREAQEDAVGTATNSESIRCLSAPALPVHEANLVKADDATISEIDRLPGISAADRCAIN